MISNQPLSEQYRLLAKQYVKLDAVARRLEEGKTTFLEKQKGKVVSEDPKTAENKAERIVKSSKEWDEYVDAMVDARTAANEIKEELQAIRMQHAEQQSYEASKRAEMRL
jgi:ATPase subunit of ABC transporter with duplicated ATPase domains